MDEKEVAAENFNKMVVNQSDDDYDDESENFSESFMCCICRDLLYKPVVLACGHVSCFWCVHKSMSGMHKSRCPICRNQYFHFPYICQKLHFLLLKLYPSAYKRRENQIFEEEKKMEYFSPQINCPVHQLQPEETKPRPSDASMPCNSDADASPSPRVVSTVETLGMKEHVQSGSEDIGLAALLDHRKDTALTSGTLSEDGNSNQTQSNGPFEQVSVGDVMCDSCNLMIFRPIVLNCGHAFCFCCIVITKGELLKCQVCESPHPGDIPKICLEFHHFLEEHFPEEYGLRIGTSQMKQEQSCNEASSTSTTARKGFHLSISMGEDPLSWLNASPKVHFGIGCDSCGMYPIIGDRYRCKDCLEKIGYDLCKDCYSTSSKLPGRFNQQHTSEHEFEIQTSSKIQEMMIKLIRVQLEEAPVISSGSANVNPPPDHINEDGENVADAPLPPSEAEANQNENQ